MSGRMDDVELVEPAGDEPAVPGDGAAVAARRSRVLRVVRRWWPVPVLAVAGLVAWQVSTASRDQERAERLRATTGVIGETITPPLETRAWGTPATALPLFSGSSVDGLVVGPVYPTTDRADLVGLDAADGAEVWRVTLAERPGAAAGPDVTCGDPDGRTLWCFLDEAGAGPGPAARRTRLVEVDLDAHAVVQERDLPEGASATVSGDLLAVATTTPEGVVVEGSDVAGGAPRWRTVLGQVDGGVVSLAPDDGHLLVWGPSDAWALDPADGRVQAEGPGLAVQSGRLLDWQGSTAVRLLGADGRGTARTEGAPLRVWPDDGSGGGLLLLLRYDGTPAGQVRAVDPETGAVAWERSLPRDGTGNLVLLDGLLYGAGGTTVWAVDALTGADVWSAEGARADPAGNGLLTDGRSLLRAEREAGASAGSEDRVLAAYRLGDGRRLWTTPLPPDVGTLWSQQGRLFGQVETGVSTLR